VRRITEGVERRLLAYFVEKFLIEIQHEHESRLLFVFADKVRLGGILARRILLKTRASTAERSFSTE